MKIEKLTDEEREYLTRGHGWVQHQRKALRIVDAQAAALERVRVEMAFEWVTLPGLRGALERALAAAPEHTAPGHSGGERQSGKTLDMLLARVAELEAECGALQYKLKAELESDWKGKALAERLEKNAANARIAELEKQRDDLTLVAMGRASAESFYAEVSARKAAETEAASLRDSLVTTTEAAALRAEVERLRVNQVDKDAWAALLAERDEAKRRVERLRTLIEQNAREALVMPVQDLRDRLATATALLEPIRAEIQTCEAEALQRDPEDETHIQADGYRHIRAMLSTTPAPSERAAAERAVLDASAALHASDLDWMHGLSMGRRTTIRDVAAAELARRAVSK